MILVYDQLTHIPVDLHGPKQVYVYRWELKKVDNSLIPRSISGWPGNETSAKSYGEEYP